MKSTLLVLLLYTSVLAKAQLVWNQGEAILTTGVTLHGDLCYQPTTDVLLFRMPDKLRTYTTDQLRQFHFFDLSMNRFRTFATYELTLLTGETRSVIFEELIPGASVSLLRLPVMHVAQWRANYGLPTTRTQAWQMAQHWYVWLDGRLLAPDVFVDTELEGLVATSAASVQQWAGTMPRPNSPLSLIKWLANFNARTKKAQSEAVYVVTASTN